MNIKKAIEHIKKIDQKSLDDFILSLDMSESIMVGAEDRQWTYEAVLDSLSEKNFIDLYSDKWDSVAAPLFQYAYETQKYEAALFIASKYIRELKKDRHLPYDTYELINNLSHYYNKSNVCYKKLNNALEVSQFIDKLFKIVETRIQEKKFLDQLEIQLLTFKVQHCIMFADLEGFKTIEKSYDLTKIGEEKLTLYNSVAQYNNAINRDLLNYLKEKQYINEEKYQKECDRLVHFIRYIFKNISINEIHLEKAIDFERKDFLEEDIPKQNLSQLMYDGGYHLHLQSELFDILANDNIDKSVKEFFKHTDTLIAKHKNSLIHFNEHEVKALILLESNRGVYKHDNINRESNYYDSIDMSKVDKAKIIQIFTEVTYENSIEAEKFLLNLSLKKLSLDKSKILKV